MLEDEVELLVPVFLVVEDVDVPVVFFVVAPVAEVVDVVSCCLHAVMKAAATIAVINPRTNFFIVKVVEFRDAETVQFVAQRQVICAARLLRRNGRSTGCLAALKSV